MKFAATAVIGTEQKIDPVFKGYLGEYTECFATMGLVDYLDILLLAYLIYKGIKIIKETRAEQLIKGIILLAILFFVVNQFQLKAMKVIIETFLNVGIIAILIVFQPELRRVLEKWDEPQR